LRGRFDLIVNTVSAKLPIDPYLSLLRVDGTLVNVGAPPEPLPVQVFSLIGGRKSFAGSAIGGIRETQEMLNFCAEHDIGAAGCRVTGRGLAWRACDHRTARRTGSGPSRNAAARARAEETVKPPVMSAPALPGTPSG